MLDVPALQAAPGGPAAACSLSSVQTCTQDAVGGASQDSTREGGGPTQTPMLSGRVDGSGTVLTAVLPLNSPLLLALPTPVESRKSSGQRCSLWRHCLCSEGWQRRAASTLPLCVSLQTRKAEGKEKTFCPDQVPSENWRKQDKWPGPGQEWASSSMQSHSEAPCVLPQPRPLPPVHLNCSVVSGRRQPARLSPIRRKASQSGPVDFCSD